MLRGSYKPNASCKSIKTVIQKLGNAHQKLDELAFIAKSSIPSLPRYRPAQLADYLFSSDIIDPKSLVLARRRHGPFVTHAVLGGCLTSFMADGLTARVAEIGE